MSNLGVSHRDGGDSAEIGNKHAMQIMILLPHYMWVENNTVLCGQFTVGSFNFRHYQPQVSCNHVNFIRQSYNAK